MTEISRQIDAPGRLWDVDVAPDGHWAAVVGPFPGEVLFDDGRRKPLPRPFLWPLIRWLDSNRLVVVNRDVGTREANAFFLDGSGVVVGSFTVGDGVKDVVPLRESIVVTYDDEGICGTAPSVEGLAVFSASGGLQFGYRTQFGLDAVEICDCYCAAVVSDEQLAFLPYTGFQYVRLNVRSRTQDVVATPSPIHGARALAQRADAVWFHSPYTQRGSILRWNILDDEVQVVGREDGELRGLRAGKFLQVMTGGYRILSWEGSAE